MTSRPASSAACLVATRAGHEEGGRQADPGPPAPLARVALLRRDTVHDRDVLARARRELPVGEVLAGDHPGLHVRRYGERVVHHVLSILDYAHGLSPTHRVTVRIKGKVVAIDTKINPATSAEDMVSKLAELKVAKKS